MAKQMSYVRIRQYQALPWDVWIDKRHDAAVRALPGVVSAKRDGSRQNSVLLVLVDHRYDASELFDEILAIGNK